MDEELRQEGNIEVNDNPDTEQDGDKEIYEGGPTFNQLEAWKSQFKAIYLTEFDDENVFIWRALNRKEYKDVMKIDNADQFYKEERICEKCVLWPQNFGFLAMSGGKAGIPSYIAEQIMDKSGFVAKTGALKL
ncbi:MAG TPA: tail chaperonin [Pseudoneobacillus sp.]|jgi:hypothetical protein|nr:tail chaperonin [Pseudoneobacillus sp.]